MSGILRYFNIWIRFGGPNLIQIGPYLDPWKIIKEQKTKMTFHFQNKTMKHKLWPLNDQAIKFPK